jgi:N-acetylglucosaminyl-diphospho-decaprenol L-rhamnosyltransferase
MSLQKDVAVIVVGINSKEYVRQLLRSLPCADMAGYSLETVYIDNASADGSAEMVRLEFPGVTVLANRTNVGFCAACNQGVAATNSRYIYLLNNDTVVLPGSLAPLLRFLNSHPEAGAAGNRLLNPDLTDQWSARRFPTWSNALFGRRTWLTRIFPNAGVVRDYLYKEHFALGRPFAVDWIPGSCTLVRREAYRQVGGLPEDMHYWSDALFCGRLRGAGWQIYIVPEAPLIHHEGHGTGGKSRAVRKWLIADFHNGAYRFYCEHYRLGPWHPGRWIARLGLGLRARMLVLADRAAEPPVTA